MKKKLFDFNTKTIVAIGLGAALVTILFMYVKIPTPIPETQIQTSYGLISFFAALFGPIAGALIAIIGHALSDSVQYGSIWWSWVIASGVAGLLMGLVYSKLEVEDGVFTGKQIVIFNIYQVGAHAIAWLLVAPILDIVIYGEPVALLLAQGATALVTNAIGTGVIGTLLLLAYSKTRSTKGSLTKS